MKKIGILLAILLVAGVCAMADEAVAVQGDALFADVDAVMLSTAEMEAVDGGRPHDVVGDRGLSAQERFYISCDAYSEKSAKQRAEKDRKELNAYANAAYGLATISVAFVPAVGPHIAAGMGAAYIVRQCRRESRD
ncbi:MAG TPA: hypothetical protein VMX33_04000 [bacterium]|nr:hypothetical protein [bacterium]